MANNANRADAALAGQSASPDASLTRDDGFVPIGPAGLSYPFADHQPDIGKLTEVGPGVYWAKIPLPQQLGHINSWLLDDGDEVGPGLAVVDTGVMMAECSDAWKALFADALAGKRLTRVFCTHMHPDHIGLAGWIASRFDIPIHMTRGEWMTAKYMVADVRDEPPPEVTAMQKAAGWDADRVEEFRALGWGMMTRAVFRLPYGYRRLVEGQRLAIGGREWAVIVGSGHSPEHACLYNAADGILISGDQLLPEISSNVSLISSEPEADPLGEWLASIDKLLQLPEDTLVCPAHGQPFRGMHRRLTGLRDGHLSRLDLLADALRTPRRVVDCFSLLFHREITGFDYQLATGETLAHLRWLERAGRVRRETRDGVWWWSAS